MVLTCRALQVPGQITSGTVPSSAPAEAGSCTRARSTRRPGACPLVALIVAA